MDIAEFMEPSSAVATLVSRTTSSRCNGFAEQYVSACDFVIHVARHVCRQTQAHRQKGNTE